ncbi:uncharacterized protein G2W53_003708 [Senna tora]|uniref:Uncharacterized protein n=1 Tax=Senna tora TaxID=362788 RepID=A0A835CIN5_9FABA|nr:uncharacterized protein G2W53_003708 [Senna tora]
MGDAKPCCHGKTTPANGVSFAFANASIITPSTTHSLLFPTTRNHRQREKNVSMSL